MTVRAGTKRPAFPRRWWRSCVAWCALVALAWPSLGPLPFLVHDFGAHLTRAEGHDHAARDAAGAHGDVAQHDDDHASDASSIPGSPTHPLDHDCAECEVLKHLSRCVLPTLDVAIIAPVVVSVVTQRVAVVRPPAQVVAHLPPARAPPLPIA